jgi:hypothetical protein
VTDNVSLDIQTGAQIQSGQNTGIGAYAGNVLPTADGSAQAYILGFIPVSGGTDSATPHTSATITMNGSIVAGVVHTIVIDIPDCALDGIFCNVMNVSGMASPPGTSTSPGAYSATYSPFDFVATFMHGDAAAFLIANIPAKGVTVGAVGFNPLYASGGQVFVEADRLVGGGSINAYGGPTISITNESPDYLQFSQIVIPDIPGGHVLFTGAADPSPSGASALNANQIFIEATYIDIDSKINVGAPTDWSIHLPASLNNLIANAGPGIYALPGATVVAPADSRIDVSYDGTAHKILVNKVTASAQAAASIKLEGGIISTTTYGNIHVNAGLGKVTIQNDTTAPVEVQDIYTGLASRTGGVTGSVEIYDTLTASGPNHWWYIFTPGVGTNVYNATGASATLQNGANFQYSTTGQSFSYSPQSGTRWEWAKMAFLAQDVSNIPANAGAWFWTDPSFVGLTQPVSDPWYWVDTVDPLSAVAGSKGTLFSFNGSNLNQIPDNRGLGVFSGSYPTTILTKDPGRAGILTFGNNPFAPNFTETITGGVGLGAKMITNADCMWRNDKHCYSWNGNFNTDWSFDYLGRAFVKVTVSVKADNPIGIDFGGPAAGLVSIISSAPVTINGMITNPNGTTTITSIFGGITSSFAGSIKTSNLNLSAGGAIGSATQPLVGTLTQGGVLDAVGNAGVYLKLDSAVNVSRILAANGNVALKAQGDIVGVGPGTKVVGNAVNLQSVNGAIGSLAAPLTVRATGRFDASALHDIAIEQVSGNLAVGEIASIAGDVSLTVDSGVLLDAAGTTASGALSDDQIQSIWSTLHLTAAYGSVANAAHTVTALENDVNNAYQQYWVLLTHGSVQNGVFVLDASSVLLYGPVAAASGLTAQAYANGLYQNFVAMFAADIGVNWQGQAQFGAFDPNYHFTASATQITNLTGNATWTDGELSSFIPLAALAPSQNTSVGSATANASGHNLTLDGSNGIGTLAAPLPITISDLRNGNLTLAQEKALALAKTPGDVTVGAQVNGITQFYSLDALPAGAVITGIQIRQTAPFFINENTKVDAHAAQGSIYLQESAGSMTIGTIAAGTGDVSLTAPNSILNVTPGAPYRISGNVISLLAGSGDIGAANDPITYRGAALASASAGGSIYIDVFGGDLVLGRVFAGNTAVLDALSGGISASLGGVAIQANDLILHARAGDIGSLASALQIDVSGILNGDASGAVYLFAPHTALHIGDVTAGGDLSITATAGLMVDPLTSLNGNVIVASGGDAELDKVTAAGTVNATAVGALTLGNISSGGATSLGARGAIVVLPGDSIVSGDALIVTQGASLTMGANSVLSAVKQVDVTVSGAAVLGQVRSTLNADHAITLHAGTISGNGDGHTNIVANGLLARSYLSAASGIGSSSRAISVDTPWLNPTTSSGDIYLAARSPLIVPNIVAPGVFSLSGSSLLTLGSITAGKDIVLQAVNNIDVGPLSGTTGDVSVKSSAGALHGGSISTAGNTTLGAAGAIVFTDISSGKTTTLTAGDLVTLHNVISTTGIGINAVKDIAFNLLSSPGGDVSAKSTVGAIKGGSIATAGNTTLTATGAILLTDINAGKTTGLTAGDAVTVHNNTSPAGIGINAVKDITFNLLNSTGGAVSVTSSGGAINGGSIVAAGSVTLTAAGAVVFTNINAGQGILIVPSAGLLANAAGTTDVSVASLTGAIHGNAITTPGSVMLDAAGAIVFTDIDAGGDANLSAGAGIDGHHLAAAGIVTIQISGGTFHIADLKATDLNLTSPGALVLDNLQIGKTVNIYAPTFDVHIVHTGSGPLLINAAGAKRDTVVSGNLDIDSPGGVIFGHYNAVNGVITTNADMVLISNGHVTGTLKLTTLRAVVLFDNTSPTPHGGNLVQLFAPAFDFVLLQDGLTTRTNAYTGGLRHQQCGERDELHRAAHRRRTSRDRAGADPRCGAVSGRQWVERARRSIEAGRSSRRRPCL